MINKPLTFFTYVICILLSACSEEKTYQYYLEHPRELPPLVSECQTRAMVLQAGNSECALALKAAKTIISIVSQAEANPEWFGEQVMRMQEQYVMQRESYHKAKEAWVLAKEKNMNQDEIKSLEKAMNQSKTSYDDTRATLSSYLAVLGLSSPE